MGILKDRKKFKTPVRKTNPTNSTGNTKLEANDFDINSLTIKKQQNKTNS